MDHHVPTNDTRQRHVGFVLIPGFSMIAMSAALEPLRMANQLSDKALYQWSLLSTDGAPVKASCGIPIAVDGVLGAQPSLDLALVCGGIDVHQHAGRELMVWLRCQAARRVPLGAVCTGGYLLARAGVLNGYRCTLHWEHIACLAETVTFPQVQFTPDLFVLDRDRYTCSGGVAPLDMMLNLIARQHGGRLAEAIAEEFLHERIRDFHDRQHTPLKVRFGTSQPKLIEVVSLMEANLYEPLSLDELASHAGLSRRQLERLFQRYLDGPPSRYYMDLRLAQARRLLLQTEMAITDVAIACGFVSPPHFAKCYQERYGYSPSKERRRKEERLTAQAELPALRTL